MAAAVVAGANAGASRALSAEWESLRPRPRLSLHRAWVGCFLGSAEKQMEMIRRRRSANGRRPQRTKKVPVVLHSSRGPAACVMLRYVPVPRPTKNP